MSGQAKGMAHDPEQTAREGDLVEIESTRPLSRRKRWRVVRVLRRGPVWQPPTSNARPKETADTEATA